MAKRGYRGKHPYNDMKVSKYTGGGISKAANNSKLIDEYNGISPKLKYQYIRDHEGFYPQGTMEISGTNDLVAASTISMSSYDGNTLYIKGVNGSTNTGNRVFKTNGTAAQASSGIRDVVNANFAGKISASVSSDIVTLTQDEPGPDGNTELTLGAANINLSVYFNSTAANSSGSLFFTNG